MRVLNKIASITTIKTDFYSRQIEYRVISLQKYGSKIHPFIFSCVHVKLANWALYDLLQSSVKYFVDPGKFMWRLQSIFETISCIDSIKKLELGTEIYLQLYTNRTLWGFHNQNAFVTRALNNKYEQLTIKPKQLDFELINLVNLYIIYNPHYGRVVQTHRYIYTIVVDAHGCGHPPKVHLILLLAVNLSHISLPHALPNTSVCGNICNMLDTSINMPFCGNSNLLTVQPMHIQMLLLYV